MLIKCLKTILCEYCRLIILLYWCICSHLQYKQQYRNSMTKLFADLELKKQKMEEQESKDKKRQKRRGGGRCRVQGKEWKSEWEVGITRLLHVESFLGSINNPN